MLKKIISSILAVAMVAAMSTSVMAEKKEEGDKKPTVRYDITTGKRTTIISTDPRDGMKNLVPPPIDKSGIIVKYDLATGERTEKGMILPQMNDSIDKLPPKLSAHLLGKPTTISDSKVLKSYELDTVWKRVTSLSSYPYRAIAQLTMTYPSGTVTKGTGVMVNGGGILTVAHYLKNANGEYPTSITAHFGRSNSSIYESVTTEAISFAINGMWDSYSDNPFVFENFDYGVINVPESTNLLTGEFGLDANINSDATYSLTGYPNAGVYYDANNMRTDSGKLTSIDMNSFDYTMKSCNGMGGSPIYTKDNYIVGIHSLGKDNSLIDGTATAVTPGLIKLVINRNRA